MSQQSKQPVSNGKLCEFKPDLNLRPVPLTSQSTLMETHQFYAQFSKYIKSSNSLPDGSINAQAAVTMDVFWLTEIKNRGFNKDTNLNDFICLIKDVTLSKFSLDTRRATLFDAKHQDTEDPADFLETLTNLIGSTDWTKISPETATCYFFMQGVKNKVSKISA